MWLEMNCSVKCCVKVKYASCKPTTAGVFRRKEVLPPYLQLRVIYPEGTLRCFWEKVRDIKELWWRYSNLKIKEKKLGKMTQREHQKEQTQGQETGFTGWDTNTG